MTAYPPPSALKKFLQPYDPDIRDLALQLREGSVESELLLSPRQIRRDQLVDVGIDREVTRGEQTASERYQDRQDHHEPCPAAAEVDCRDDPGRQRAARPEARIVPLFGCWAPVGVHRDIL